MSRTAIEYNSNNSGGEWWLSDQDWKDLEAAGWAVDWIATTKYPPLGRPRPDGRWLGALATSAYREGLSRDAAIAEWERVTGKDSEAGGCSCCGSPHYFRVDDDYEPESALSVPPEGPE